jgi:hypothetical protein
MMMNDKGWTASKKILASVASVAEKAGDGAFF